jgi:crotonobetainyl-CoA:carnitine CoA-transferase CaiB-like acyl-CoA transferase
MTKPALEGIQVLELGQMIPPAAGYMLGDMGANVIKIEDPVHGDIYRGMTQMYGSTMSWAGGTHVGFETANRNKKSITLDLKQEKGKEIFYKLIDKSDVFLTNFSEQICRKLGADYETLHRRNPSLVWARASNYGPEGPSAEKRGYDPTAQAMSGLMWAIGERDCPEPMQTGSTICDTMAATMLAYGILAALVARERHGIGQRVDVSLLGSMLHLQAQALMVTSLRGRPWARHSRKRVRNPFTNHYKCADAKWIMLSEAQADRYWHEICSVLSLQDLEEDPRFATAMGGRREHSAELIEILDKVFLTKTRDEWIKLFDERNVGFAYAPVYNYHEVLEEPQVLSNDYVVEFTHPVGGKVKVIGFPVKFSETPCSIQSSAPEHGQHTEEILLDLNYTWEDIAQLRNEGVI